MIQFLVQIFPLMLMTAIALIPFLRILKRVGRSGWWVLFLFVPFFGLLIMPWIIGFMRWNRDPNAAGDVFR